MENSKSKVEGSEPAKAPDPTGKRVNRRGKGSKSKQAEQFRVKKNKEFDDTLIKKIEDIKISLGYTPRDLFGDRMLTAIIRPQIKFPVNTAKAANLCSLVAEVLHIACKIPASVEEDVESIAFDEETLKWVTSLQIEAKMYHARINTQYADFDSRICDRVRRTNLLLSSALTPLGVFVDQIGRFIFQEQTFIPVFNDVNDFAYVRLENYTNPCRAEFRSLSELQSEDGVLTTHTDFQGRRLRAVLNVAARDQAIALGIIDDNNDFILAFLQNPQAYNFVGIVNFIPERRPPSPPTFTEIVRRYAELRGRVSKKLQDVFVELSLDKGMGSESQLTYLSPSIDGTCLAWSPKAIRADALEVGAVLGLGYANQMSCREYAAALTTIDLSAGLETLANILTKRLR